MKYVCVHGHFYQPPRENPSLEAIELQDSAYPYHDWNDRVTAECYAPNAISRLLDDRQRIVKLINNYSQMSFNFGPTLLLWMEQNAPALLESIREADKAKTALARNLPTYRSKPHMMELACSESFSCSAWLIP